MDAWSFIDADVAIARSNVKSQPATSREAPEAYVPRTSQWGQQRSPAKKGGAWPTTSPSSSSSQHCLLSEVSYKALPRALQRVQSSAQSVSSTQVIPELNALAITVDTKLHLWFYSQQIDGDGDGEEVAVPAAEFPGLVLSVALSAPKASVVSQPAFKELVVPYVLVSATTEGVYLHLVCRNAPVPFSLIPSSFFFATPRSNPMIRVAGSSSGAIFCTSADGYLYSLNYDMEQQRSSLLAVWPAGGGGLLHHSVPRQQLVKHTPGQRGAAAAAAQSSIVGQLFSFAASTAAEEPSLSLLHGDVADLAVDDVRGIVYVLYSRGVLGYLHFQAAGAAPFSLVDLGKALGESSAVQAARVFPLSPCEVDTAAHGFVLLVSGVRVDFQSSPGSGAGPGVAVCGVSSCLQQQRQGGLGEAAGSVAAYCMGTLVTAGLDRKVCGSRGGRGASVVALRAEALSIRADCLVKDDVASSRLLSAALAPEAALTSLLLPHVDFLLPAAGEGASDGTLQRLRGSKSFTAVSSVALKQLPVPASASFVVGSRAGVHLLSLEASEYRSDEELASALVASLCDPANSASSVEGHFEALLSALRPGAGSQALVAVSPSPVQKAGPPQSPYKLVLARQASRIALQSVLINGLQVDVPEKLPVAAGAALYLAHQLLPLWSTPLVVTGGWTPCFDNNAQACGPVLAALETLQDVLVRILEAAAPSSRDADEEEGSAVIEDLSAVLRLASRALAVLRLLQEATYAVPQAIAAASYLTLLQGHTLSSVLAEPSLLRRFLHAAVAAVSQGHASYGSGAEDDDGEGMAFASSLLRASDRHAPAVSSDLWSAVDLWEAAGLALLHDLARISGGQLSEDDIFHVERNLLPAAEAPGGWSLRAESRSIVLRHPDKSLAGVCGLLRDLAIKASAVAAFGVVRAAHQAIVHICTAAAESLLLAFPGSDAARFAYEAMLDAMPPFDSNGAGAGEAGDGAVEMSSPDTTELLSMLDYMLHQSTSSSPSGSPGGGAPRRPVPLSEVCRYFFARRPQVLTSAPLLSTGMRDCLLDMLRQVHAEAAAAGGSRELDGVLRVLFSFLMALGDHHSLVLCIQVLSQCTHVDAQPRLINQAHIERLEFMLVATDRLLRIEGCSAEDCQAVCLGWILGRVQLELTSKLDAPGLHELGAVLGSQLLSASEWFDPGPRCVARALASLTDYPGVAVLLLRAVEAVEATSSSSSSGGGGGVGSSGFTREERRTLWRSAIDSGSAEDVLEDLVRIEQWRARSIAASSSSAASAQSQAQAPLVGVSLYILERLFDAERQQYSDNNDGDGDEDDDETEPDACQVLSSLGFSRTDVLVAGMGILTSLHASRGLKPLGLEFQLSANQLEMLLSLLVRLLHDWVCRARQDSLKGAMPQDVILLSNSRALDRFVESVRFFLGEGAAGAEEEQKLFAEVVQTISLLWR